MSDLSKSLRERLLVDKEWFDIKQDPIIEKLISCVEALEWYDNVHRNHWAIDLNDLDKIAKKALAALEKELDNDEDYDSTPWCNACRAMKREQCDCGPIAEND